MVYCVSTFGGSYKSLDLLIFYQILHNIALAEYFRDGCTDPNKLLEALNNVKVS